MKQIVAIVLASLALAPASARTEREVPFNVGETLTYDVSWSSYLTAGTATTTVKEKRASANSTAYYIVAEGRPTPLLSKLYSLYYKLDTLVDSYSLLSQRGSVYSEEGRRHRYKTTEFDRAAKKVFFEYKSDTVAKADFATSAVTQDALAAFYVLRTMPLKPGDHMTMPVSDDGDTYALRIDVVGRERLKTVIGTLDAWKMAMSLTDNKGQAVGRPIAFWMSADARHVPVRIQTELAVGSFNLTLREIR